MANTPTPILKSANVHKNVKVLKTSGGSVQLDYAGSVNAIRMTHPALGTFSRANGLFAYPSKGGKTTVSLPGFSWDNAQALMTHGTVDVIGERSVESVEAAEFNWD